MKSMEQSVLQIMQHVSKVSFGSVCFFVNCVTALGILANNACRSTEGSAAGRSRQRQKGTAESFIKVIE